MKKQLSLIIFPILCVILLAGCGAKKNTEKAQADYSQYAFVNTWWTRDADHDTETIYFGSDGSFRYSCGCGNPVNDADLCEGYTYDDAAKTITLHYTEPMYGTVTTIQVVKCDANSLHLDFDGEIRIFTK